MRCGQVPSGAAGPELVSVGTLLKRGVHCFGKTLLTEGQTLSAQRTLGAPYLGKTEPFCYMLGTTPG